MTKFSYLVLVLLSIPYASADIDVVYGEDNRKEVYQSSAALQKYAQATAAMIPAAFFAKTSNAQYFDLKNTKTLETGSNICASEAFSNQPTAASCSGFLVSEDTIVTAGHCYKSFSTPENVCKSFAWVFDYNLKSEKADPTKNIPIQNIYLCKEVIKAELSAAGDYAIIKLHRKVTGRTPFKLRTSGKVGSGSLTVIGHPSGLPSKISDGGKVINNSDSKMFVTNLDTFHGNSGSAVIDTATGVIEGILVQGKTDYVASIKGNAKSCMVVNRCDDNGLNCTSGKEANTPPGEMVYRITNITQFLK